MNEKMVEEIKFVNVVVVVVLVFCNHFDFDHFFSLCLSLPLQLDFIIAMQNLAESNK